MGACSVCESHTHVWALSSSSPMQVRVCARSVESTTRHVVCVRTRRRCLPVGFVVHVIFVHRACAALNRQRRVVCVRTRRRRRHLPVGFVRARRCCEACVRARRRCPSERAASVPGVESTTLRACVRVVVAGVELSVRGVESTTRAPQGTAGGAVVTVRAWQAISILPGRVCWGGCQHRRTVVVEGHVPRVTTGEGSGREAVSTSRQSGTTCAVIG